MKYQDVFHLLKKISPAIIFGVFFLILFRKIFLNGLYPYPGDLLVSFFFPYNSGGWEGFTSWVTHKEFVAADVVRQLYPWRQLAVDLLKEGTMPLWNPYAFSGTPLAANLQTAAFYPMNIVFFLFPFFPAWITYLLMQMIIAGIGMYLFLRSLKLSRMSAVFSACSYGCIGYLMIWFELGVVGHTASWLPFILWGITRFEETKKQMYIQLSSLFLGFSLLAGHAQTAVYVFLLSTAYFLFRIRVRKFSDWLLFIVFILFSVGIAAIQLVPSIELLLNSARNAPESSEIFHRGLLPLSHLVTVFAPDFFGNQTTGNYWGENYGEFMAYAGIVVLALAVIGVSNFRREKNIRFFSFVIIISLLFAFPGPFSSALDFFNIPVLGTAIPARTLFLVEFCLVILAAYGIDTAWFRNKNRILFPLCLLFGVYITLWGIVLLLPQINLATELRANMAVAKRNLILPTGIFLMASFIVLFFSKYRKYPVVAVILLILLAAVEYQYFFYKFNPFSPESYLYPTHPLVTELQKIAKNDRIYGYDTARIETNLPTAWRLQSPEGYDPLYIEHYGELMTGTKTGKFPHSISRSDANFAETPPNQDSVKKQHVMNLLGVRYILDKDDHVALGWQPNTNKYPEDRFMLIWQYEKWKIYENTQVLPRASVFYSWEVVQNPEKELERLLAWDFPYTTRLTVREPSFGSAIASSNPTPANIITYTPNKVVMQARAENDGILLFTDAYYPGWNAYVDGVSTDIVSVDYTLRGVPLKKGNHSIVFHYQPISFYAGAAISGVSALVLSLLMVSSFRQKRK